MQEKSILLLTFSPGLALTSFRTTRPMGLAYLGPFLRHVQRGAYCCTGLNR